METISKIRNLYAFEDGDSITPRMGVQIAAGYGLQQYYDPNTGNVTATKFADHPATLFPQAWSSKRATIIVPEAGYQWYYNNISDNSGILDSNGQVKAAFSDRFEVVAAGVTMNGQTYPALKIKADLVSATLNDYNDKWIYFVGSYNGKQFTCAQQIPVMAAVGDPYNILLSVTGANGTGDEVLSADQDWVQYTAYLQLAGSNVSGGTITFQHLSGNTWQDVSHQAGMTEISGTGNNTLKLYAAAVEGTEMYRVRIVYNGKTYYKTMQVSDIHDPFYIDDGCNISGDAVKVGETATFSPKVYERSSGTDVTTSGGWQFRYTLIKRSDSSVISTHTTSPSITYATIESNGGISVRIEAYRS